MIVSAPRHHKIDGKRKKRLILSAMAISLLIVSAIAVLFHEQILLSVGEFLVIRDNLQPADVIHVIAGSDHRTNYGIQLLQQGYGKYIFFTGGWCTQHQFFHGQHGKELAIEQGVQSEAVVIDDSQVISTYEEAQKLKDFIARSPEPIHSVIVVSDPHHMRRAQWTYRWVLGNQISIQIAPVPYELSPRQQDWWNDLDTTKMVFKEYLKYIYYRLRYQLARGELKEWLAGLDQK